MHILAQMPDISPIPADLFLFLQDTTQESQLPTPPPFNSEYDYVGYMPFKGLSPRKQNGTKNKVDFLLLDYGVSQSFITPEGTPFPNLPKGTQMTCEWSFPITPQQV